MKKYLKVKDKVTRFEPTIRKDLLEQTEFKDYDAEDDAEVVREYMGVDADDWDRHS